MFRRAHLAAMLPAVVAKTSLSTLANVKALPGCAWGATTCAQIAQSVCLLNMRSSHALDSQTGCVASVANA